jgi:transposase
MADVNPGLAGCTLTLRQQRILVLLAQGLTNREIAHRLRLSARTVRAEVRQILSQLTRESRRAHIEVRSGQEEGLVSAAPPEAAWVKFWSSPRLTAAAVVTLMLVVLLRFLHDLISP